MASGSGVSGDFAKLRKLRAMLERMPENVKRNAVIAVAAEVRTLVAMGFRKSVAPDGSKWAPLKERDGKPLVDTANLQNSFTTSVDGGRGRIEVGTSVAYADFHQTGTKHMPARKMIPDDGEMPERWARPLREVVNEVAEAEVEKMPK